MNASRHPLAFALLALLGCSAESNNKNTGGVEGDGGECASGVAVVMSDYVSTQVALSSLDGETQSASFISTGSSKTDGLSYALSGDVALPSTRPASGNVVLLDRFGTNVVTWIAPKTAKVLGQLALGTGFESNPSDYLEINAKQAYVTRWGDNAAPGQEDFDTGGDVLLIDTENYEIDGVIDLPRSAIKDASGEEAEKPYPPRPVGMTKLGDTVLIPLERLADDYGSMGDAVLVGVSILRELVVFELPLDGLKACGRMAISPDGKTLAMACTGYISATGEVEDAAQSALLLFDAKSSPPKELARFAATELTGGASLQNDVVFASNGTVLLKTQTGFGGEDNNRWLAVNTETGDTKTLLTASPDDEGLGKGLVYGGMVCSPGCSKTCLLADGDLGNLARASVGDDGEVTLEEPVTVETEIGMPPRDVSLR